MRPLTPKTALLVLHLPHVLAADKPYSTWMTDSIIARGVALTRWYTEATFYRSVETVFNRTSSPTYLTFLNISLTSILPAPLGSGSNQPSRRFAAYPVATLRTL